LKHDGIFLFSADKQTYLFLSAQQHRFVDENTGQINEGVSLWYLPDNTLDPEHDEIAARRGEVVKGKKVGKVAIPQTLASKLSEFPALYEVTMGISEKMFCVQTSN